MTQQSCTTCCCSLRRVSSITSEHTKTGRIIKAHVIGLNWTGHEFLDSVRSDKIWRKLLKYAKDKGGALPFELLKTLAVELLKKSIE